MTRVRINTCVPSTIAIIESVATKYGYHPDDFANLRRSRAMAFARHEAIYQVRMERALTLYTIGQIFGGRDHTTILHAIRSHAARMAWCEVLTVFADFQEQPSLFARAA